MTSTEPATTPGPTPDRREVDVAVIGAGQSGLATGYYLQRAGLHPGDDFVLLDAGSAPGGAWPHMWEGLHLFSPPAYSSLPGWPMPPWNANRADRNGFPSRRHVVDYLTAYEQRYRLAPLRPHRVSAVVPTDDDPRGLLLVRAPRLEVRARVVISATGTWDQPFWPRYPGAPDFRGRQLHAADYRSPAEFAGRRVVIVGGGNSAAQILAEISAVADPPGSLNAHRASYQTRSTVVPSSTRQRHASAPARSGSSTPGSAASATS